MRVAVYTDYAYHVEGGRPKAQRAFALFVAELAERLDRVVVLGRRHPDDEGGRYPLGRVDYVPLPYYEALSRPVQALRGMAGSLGALWRSLGDVDCVWVLGPHPLGIAYCLMALARRRRVVLGVRQDSRAYIRSRHPGRHLVHLAGDAMDLAFRAIGRLSGGVVAVGPSIAGHYSGSRDVLEISVSLVREDEIAPPALPAGRDYSGELTILSVGRLEDEKNPLGLAEVLAELDRRDPGRWRMLICGEGELRGALEERLGELGVAERAELLGYVPHGPELQRLYRESHALLHVSWTEGLPQVLFEAFGARLPVVATAVGGIPEAAGDAALLIPPGDAQAGADRLGEIAADAALRERLTESGAALLAERTLEAEAERVAGFLSRDR